MIDANDGLVVKNLLAAASPLIKSVVDAFVAPKLKSLRDRLSIDSRKHFVPTEDHFTEYFHRTYKKVSVVNTLVFNNSQRILNDIYVPLTLSHGEDDDKFKMSSFPLSIMRKYQKLLVTDAAGMGKSTLMKFLFMQAIDKGLGIPILVELRRLSKDKTIVMEIQELLSSISKEFDSFFLFELLAEGGFVIILDGYDEIGLSAKDAVTSDLQGFIQKASNNFFFMTSRPEKALSSFGDFREYSIDPLKKKEAFDLLRKYDRGKVVSKLLIKKLQETEMDNVEEFLINPLLVSLLFTAFEHKQTVPFKKYLFYRQVYDANFESHDLTKGDSYIHDKRCGLEIDDFHRVLRYLGFRCLKNQKIEFSKDEILKMIGEANEFCVGLEFRPSDFLNDLIITVPLFTKDGVYYRWSHKSLQEYFAAQFIYLDAKGRQEEILTKILHHRNLDKLVNVLDLFYDMDYKAFRNTILRELLRRYKNQFDALLNECIGIPREQVIERSEVAYLLKSVCIRVNYDRDLHGQEDEQFDLELREYCIERGFDLEDWFGVLQHYGRKEGVWVMNFQDSMRSVFEVLMAKRNKVLETTDFDSIDQDVVSSLGAKMVKYQLYELDGAPKAPFDQSDYHLITIVIAQSKLDGLKFNHAHAMREYRDIELAIKMEGDRSSIWDAF